MTLTNLSPTIVLVDELDKDRCSIKLWLETNGYNVREVSEIYDAFEEMTDITLEQRPSMILLNSYSSAQDCLWVIDSLCEFAGEQPVPIVALSESNNINSLAVTNEHFVQVQDFDSLKPLMQSLLPVHWQARAAI